MSGSRKTLIVFASFFFSWINPAAADEQVDETRDLVDLVVAGIQHNYSQIRGFKASVQMIIEDLSMQKAETISEKLPGGGFSSIEVSPKRILNYKIVSQGTNLRSELLDGAGKPVEIWLNFNNIFSQYHPEDAQVWKRRPNQMPGVMLGDPRQMGLLDLNYRFPDLLREQKIEHVIKHRNANGEVLIDVTMSDTNGSKILVVFSSSFSFLPVTIGYYGEDNRFIIVASIAYQKVAAREIWFPRDGIQKRYDPGVPKITETGNIRIRSIITVNELEILNENAINDSVFQIDYPNGTKIRDATINQISTIGQVEIPAMKPSPDRSLRFWAIISALALFLILGILVVRRMFFKSSYMEKL